MKRFSKEEDDYIKETYPLKGLLYCAKALNRSLTTIQNRLKILGLPRLTKQVRGELMSKPRPRPFIELSVNPEQFLNVQTPEVAYILGLLWADGWINEQKISIQCIKTDAEEYLPIFLKTGQWRHFDQYRKRYGIAMKESRTIYTGNVQLAGILKELGYKSKSNESACKILSKIPEHLKHYWFRGLVDGDGYIGNGKSSLWVKITSSYGQDWTYMENICKRLNIVYHISKDKYLNKIGKENSRSVFSIVNRSGFKLFCDYIFQGREFDKIGLSRKFNKKEEIYNFFKKKENSGLSRVRVFT